MGDVRFRSMLLALRWVWTPRAWRDTRAVGAMVGLLAQVVVIGGVAGRRLTDLLPWLSCLAMPVLAELTAAIERSASRQLQFTELLPLPRTTTKWIVLVPTGLFVSALVGSLVVLGHIPMADTVPLLGLGWWAIAVGHAFAPRRLWARIFLMPLACWLAVVASAIVGEQAGDRVASMVAGVLGVLALAVAPARPFSSAAAAGRRRSSYPPRGAPGVHALPRSRQAGTLSTSFRIWIMTTPRWSRYFLVPFFIAASVIGCLTSAPMLSSTEVMVAAILSGLLTRARSPSTLAFLQARPFTRRSLWLGTWLPAIVLVVLPPLSMLLTVQEEWFIGPTALGFTSGGANKLSYLREILGATFLPASLPAGGMPAEIWPALPPLLVRHAFRLALLSLALLFSLAGQAMASARRTDGRALWPGWLSSLLVSAMLVPCLDAARSWRIPWAPPPLWLAGAMALGAGLFAFRQDRVSSSP